MNSPLEIKLPPKKPKKYQLKVQCTVETTKYLDYVPGMYITWKRPGELVMGTLERNPDYEDQLELYRGLNELNDKREKAKIVFSHFLYWHGRGIKHERALYD